MSESVKVKVEYEALEPVEVECPLRDFVWVPDQDVLREVVEGRAEYQAQPRAKASGDDIAALWAAVQKLRGREG